MSNYYQGYWKYYSEAFDWNDSVCEMVDIRRTKDIFKSVGFTKEQINLLIDSGYVCLRDWDLVIDRFYGGALASNDGVSRLLPEQLYDLFKKPSSPVWVKKVHSLKELYKIVDDVETKVGKRILFRGQRKNYTVQRAINNPYFTIPGVGEIALLPTFWRKAYSINKRFFSDFQPLSLWEWSKIFYSAYDLQEIEKRQRAAIDNGEWTYSAQDMADSIDPMLREFGNHRLDLTMGKDFNLVDTLSTLLQHYGLLSTVLDLTSSLEVALFFATHQYIKDNGDSYKFIGTNNGKAVIYLISDNKNELVNYDNTEKLLSKLTPERPFRQHCVISRSSVLSINLPAMFLLGIVYLDFPIKFNDSRNMISNYFPDASIDKFLAALKAELMYPEYITDFQVCGEA